MSEREGMGIAEGASAFGGGIGFVLTTPSSWGYALVPAVTAVTMALLLGCLLGVLGAWGAWHVPTDWMGDHENWAAATRWLVAVSAVAGALVVSVLLGLSLAQPLSGWALEAIARKRFFALTGDAGAEPSFVRSMALSIRVTLFTLLAGAAVVGALFVVGLLFPPAIVVTVPLKFLVVSWLLAWDFLDYPLGLRGLGVRSRMAWFFRHFWAATAFGVAWTLVLLIPFVALLILPLGVAGAAQLVVEAEGRA